MSGIEVSVLRNARVRIGMTVRREEGMRKMNDEKNGLRLKEENNG